MPEEKTVQPVLQNQDIKTEVVETGFTFNPAYPRRFFVNNLIQRVWARLYGWTGTQAVRLSCTTAGYLRVASTGTTFIHNIVFGGNSPDAYGAAIDLGRICPRLDITTWDFACIVRRSTDGVIYDTEFEIPANYFFSMDCDTRYLQIHNKVAFSVCRYQFNGYY